MDKAEQSIVLEYLADGRIDEAWPLFLRCYSPHVLQIVNRFVRNDDDKSECFLYVCERLHRRDCRRLKKFDPTGPAIFTTWLHAVVYNLCRDWYRTRFPRFQPFRSVAKLPEFDQRVFRFHYELKLSLAETYEHLRVTLPDITYLPDLSGLKNISNSCTSPD